MPASEHNPKVYDCVQQVMAKGKEKVNAIRICQASIGQSYRKAQVMNILVNGLPNPRFGESDRISRLRDEALRSGKDEHIKYYLQEVHGQDFVHPSAIEQFKVKHKVKKPPAIATTNMLINPFTGQGIVVNSNKAEGELHTALRHRMSKAYRKFHRAGKSGKEKLFKGRITGAYKAIYGPKAKKAFGD